MPVSIATEDGLLSTTAKLRASSAQGIRCSPKNPRCQRHISTRWTTNLLVKDGRAACRPSPTANIAITWQGTRREKQSLHFFRTITAPELSGFLDAQLWQHLIPRAMQHDPALTHITAALGASYECQLRKQARRQTSETDELEAFSLRQCNKAINDLFRLQGDRHYNLLRALTASVLFVCLESTNGNRDQAIKHLLHSRRLLEQVKEAYCTSNGVDVYPVDIKHLEPLITHYETHMECRNQPESDNYRADCPNLASEFGPASTASFDSLTEARVALEAGLANFGTIFMGLEGVKQTPAELAEITRAKSAYSALLDRWDKSFSGYLARNAGNWDTSDLNGFRVLKAHQLSGMIVADTNYADGEASWGLFTSRFTAIVDLVTEVLQTVPRRPVSLVAPQQAYISASVGLSEPLYITATRCADPVVAGKARMLLAKLPANEGVHSAWRVEFVEKILCACTGKKYEVNRNVEARAERNLRSCSREE